MKSIPFLLIFICLCSCDFFYTKKTNPETILNEELRTFNWNDVDEYPMFSVCDTLNTKTDRKLCFENILTAHIFEFLQYENIVVTQDINDTLNLEFQVYATGRIKLLHADIDSLTLQEIPNIRKLIVKSLDSLPEIFPAIKRGQQVTTKFKLPIIINVN